MQNAHLYRFIGKFFGLEQQARKIPKRHFLFHVSHHLNTAKKFYPTYSKTLLKTKLLNDVGFAIQLAKQILKENFDYYKQKYPNKSVYQLVEMAIGAYNGGMKHDPNGAYVKKFRCIYSQVRYNE